MANRGCGRLETWSPIIVALFGAVYSVPGVDGPADHQNHTARRFTSNLLFGSCVIRGHATQTVNPTLGKDASQPTAPRTPGIPYGPPSICTDAGDYSACLPRPRRQVSVGLERRMAPRRKGSGLGTLIQHPCGYPPKAVHEHQSLGNLMNCTARL
jgi:hypothetical protein